FLHVRLDDDGLRAKREGLEHRLRRMNAERARNVASGRHDAALAAADDHRFVREARIVALLDRGVERIAIDMGDGELPGLRMADDARVGTFRATARVAASMRVAIAAEAAHCGQSHAAPRTPLESPCFGATSLVRTVGEKTKFGRISGTRP